jgi:hypothetical protein
MTHVVPDVIVHRRNTGDNLAVFEVKKRCNVDRNEDDRRKLRALSHICTFFRASLSGPARLKGGCYYYNRTSRCRCYQRHVIFCILLSAAPAFLVCLSACAIGYVSAVRERLRLTPPDVFACVFSMSGYGVGALEEIRRERNREIINFLFAREKPFGRMQTPTSLHGLQKIAARSTCAPQRT